MPTIKQQLVAWPRHHAKLTAKGLALAALRYQVHQRLLEKQYHTSHVSRLACGVSPSKQIRLTWQLGSLRDFEALRTFVDTYLRRDWFERAQALAAKLRRNRVPLLGFDGPMLVCWALMSAEGVLQNLLVHPDYRGLGIGAAALELLDAQIIRSKSDQSTGDPEEFYRRAGYHDSGLIAGRKKNIRIMIRPE